MSARLALHHQPPVCGRDELRRGRALPGEGLEEATVRGKAWVCEISSQIVGFAIVDLKENNIWALFIDPKFEKKGDRATITQNYAGLVFLQRQKKKFG